MKRKAKRIYHKIYNALLYIISGVALGFVMISMFVDFYDAHSIKLAILFLISCIWTFLFFTANESKFCK